MPSKHSISYLAGKLVLGSGAQTENFTYLPECLSLVGALLERRQQRGVASL